MLCRVVENKYEVIQELAKKIDISITQNKKHASSFWEYASFILWLLYQTNSLLIFLIYRKFQHV